MLQVVIKESATNSNCVLFSMFIFSSNLSINVAVHRILSDSDAFHLCVIPMHKKRTNKPLSPTKQLGNSPKWNRGLSTFLLFHCKGLQWCISDKFCDFLSFLTPPQFLMLSSLYYNVWILIPWKLHKFPRWCQAEPSHEPHSILTYPFSHGMEARPIVPPELHPNDLVQFPSFVYSFHPESERSLPVAGQIQHH